MLYCNSEKILRENTFADQFTESEHLEEKTFIESPLAKPIGVARYNFIFHGPEWLLNTVKFMSVFSEKFPTALLIHILKYSIHHQIYLAQVTLSLYTSTNHELNMIKILYLNLVYNNMRVLHVIWEI